MLVVFSCGLIGSAQTEQPSNESIRKVVRKVEPRYPELARKLNLGGTVKVVAVVASDGNVKKVEPVGGSPLLVQAAESAIGQWKFAPGGESREVVELHFNP
jgi:TonB family protein